jgi:hypothetical protein
VDAITLGHGAEVVTIGAAVVSTSTDPYAGCSFEVTLRGPGLVANRTVFMFAFSGLPRYFAELAQSWRGWEGVKAWESPEHDLTIEATFTPGGHDRLRFIARNGPIPTWKASVEVDVEAGEEMARIARTVQNLFPRRDMPQSRP